MAEKKEDHLKIHVDFIFKFYYISVNPKIIIIKKLKIIINEKRIGQKEI
jgi:hypothetical protein